MITFKGTIEFVTSHRAMVALTDAHGEFSGAERLDIRPRAFEGRDAARARLYEAGYAAAATRAALKGGRLETFQVISS
jgi:hypothetical protein